MRLKPFLLCIFLSILSSCSPNSLEDFQHEGEAQCKKLVKELKKIHTREELAKTSSVLKKRFDKLVDLMIEARSYQQKHPEEYLLEGTKYLASDDLFTELQRIYKLEGGREIIEKAQREALIRLDAFERSLAKQKELRPK